MTNKSAKILELFTTGSWRNLKNIRSKINTKNCKNLSRAQALLLRCLCESPLETKYSLELIEDLERENPIAALGLLISRASIAHAIAKLITEDSNAAKVYIQSSLATMLSTIHLVGLKIATKKKQKILNSASNLSNCLHSQLELKQALLQRKMSPNMTFVLGMHRSGTSALTGMLAHAGFSAPKEPMQANVHNPKGYWESTRIMQANDNLLESLNSQWSTTVKLQHNWAYTEQAKSWRKSLLNCITEEYEKSHHSIIKDPRFCILIEGLKPWLESDLINPSFIISIRDPREVVQSLKKVQNIDIPQGFLLWIAYNLRAIGETQGYERRIIDYHFLLQNPSMALSHCTEILTTNSSNRSDTFNPINFIEPNLRNEDPSSLDSKIINDGEETFHEHRKLAEIIYQIIIQESQGQPLRKETLQQLELKLLVASI